MKSWSHSWGALALALALWGCEREPASEPAPAPGPKPGRPSFEPWSGEPPGAPDMGALEAEGGEAPAPEPRAYTVTVAGDRVRLYGPEGPVVTLSPILELVEPGAPARRVGLSGAHLTSAPSGRWVVRASAEDARAGSFEWWLRGGERELISEVAWRPAPGAPAPTRMALRFEAAGAVELLDVEAMGWERAGQGIMAPAARVGPAGGHAEVRSLDTPGVRARQGELMVDLIGGMCRATGQPQRWVQRWWLGQPILPVATATARPGECARPRVSVELLERGHVVLAAREGSPAGPVRLRLPASARTARVDGRPLPIARAGGAGRLEVELGGEAPGAGRRLLQVRDPKRRSLYAPTPVALRLRVSPR